uniref:Uncharacterized protein n=1 Tax=Vespula pensylvanica TaxID=30213 RepID=A0A834NDP6_VESPE|nr:hypothetical protein H0235_014978 [Vespula pensylvanica]
MSRDLKIFPNRSFLDVGLPPTARFAKKDSTDLTNAGKGSNSSSIDFTRIVGEINNGGSSNSRQDDVPRRAVAAQFSGGRDGVEAEAENSEGRGRLRYRWGWSSGISV